MVDFVQEPFCDYSGAIALVSDSVYKEREESGVE